MIIKSNKKTLDSNISSISTSLQLDGIESPSFSNSNIALEVENNSFNKLLNIYNKLQNKIKQELNVISLLGDEYVKLDTKFNEEASILNIKLDSEIIPVIEISNNDFDFSGKLEEIESDINTFTNNVEQLYGNSIDSDSNELKDDLAGKEENSNSQFESNKGTDQNDSNNTNDLIDKEKSDEKEEVSTPVSGDNNGETVDKPSIKEGTNVDEEITMEEGKIYTSNPRRAEIPEPPKESKTEEVSTPIESDNNSEIIDKTIVETPIKEETGAADEVPMEEEKIYTSNPGRAEIPEPPKETKTEDATSPIESDANSKTVENNIKQQTEVTNQNIYNYSNQETSVKSPNNNYVEEEIELPKQKQEYVQQIIESPKDTNVINNNEYTDNLINNNEFVDNSTNNIDSTIQNKNSNANQNILGTIGTIAGAAATVGAAIYGANKFKQSKSDTVEEETETLYEADDLPSLEEQYKNYRKNNNSEYIEPYKAKVNREGDTIDEN